MTESYECPHCEQTIFDCPLCGEVQGIDSAIEVDGVIISCVNCGGGE